MIRTFLYSMFAVFLFALGAAGAWFYLQMEDTNGETDAVAAPAPVAQTATGIESLTSVAAAAPEAEMPVAVRPDPISAEELFRQTAMNKDYHKRLRQKEEQLKQDELRLKLTHKDMEARQREIDGMLAQINDSLSAGEKILSDTQLASERLAAEKLDISKQIEMLQQLEQDAGSGRQANEKRSSAWIQGMQPEEAAEVVRELANNGNMQFVLRVIRHMEERNVAKILAALNDPALAAELAEQVSVPDLQTKKL